MKIINLTLHAITFTPSADETQTITSSGVARVATTPGQDLGGGLWSAPTWGDVEGLPAPRPDTIYVVSALVAGRCVGRDDVFSPGTGPQDGAVRNERGQIVAVTRLIQAPQK